MRKSIKVTEVLAVKGTPKKIKKMGMPGKTISGNARRKKPALRINDYGSSKLNKSGKTKNTPKLSARLGGA